MAETHRGPIKSNPDEAESHGRIRGIAKRATNTVSTAAHVTMINPTAQPVSSFSLYSTRRGTISSSLQTRCTNHGFDRQAASIRLSTMEAAQPQLHTTGDGDTHESD